MNTEDGYKHKLARGTVLDPPLTFDETEYILAALFPPDGQGGERVVVSGIVEEFTRPSSGVGRIKARRGTQMSSYTRTLSAGNSSEIDYPCTTGGNIAAHAECELVLCYLNDMAKRGLNLHSRAIPGMALRKRGRLFPLSVAEPYAIAPAAVTFGSNTPLPSNAEAEIDLAHLHIARQSWASNVVFQDGGTGLFNDCRAGWRRASTEALGICTPRVFGGVAGYYPPNAAFDPATPEYHWDPDARLVRFSFPTFSTTGPASHTRVTSYHGIDREGMTATPGRIDLPVIILPAANGAGYASGEDELLAAALPLLGVGDGFVTWMAGAGAFEVRQSSAPDAPFVAVLFGSGGVTAVKWRATEGGAVSTSAISTSYAGEFDVRLFWDGADVSIYHRGPGGGAWTLATSKALANDGGGVGSLTAWSTSGLKIKSLAWAVTQVEYGIGGAIWAMQLLEREARAIQTIQRPASTAITAVVNLTTGAAMVPFAGTIRRDAYAVDLSGNVQVACEASRDRVRVTCAAPTSVPAGTGRPPRVFGQTNFATAIGDGSAADTDVNKNRANWYDKLEALDPMELLDYAPGDPFEVVVGWLVWDPLKPPVLEYSVRSASATAGWTTLPSEAFLAFWADGLVLLKTAWVAGLSLAPGDTIWLRARGLAYRRRRRPLAHHYNEPVRCIGSLDLAWVEGGGPGGTPAAEQSGITSIMRIGATDFEGEEYSSGQYWAKPVDACWGTKKRDIEEPSEIMAGWGWPGWPYYELSPIFDNQLTFHDSAKRTLRYSADDLPSYYPSEGTPGRATWNAHDSFEADEILIDVAPLSGPSGVPLGAYGENWRLESGVPVYDRVPHWANWFGGFVTGQNFLALNAYGAAVGADFGFRGVSFEFASWFQGLPDGTTILEAKLACKFGGLRMSSWQCTFNVTPVSGGFEYFSELSRDGAVIRTTEGPPFVNTQATLFPDPAKGGAVTFVLMGRRKNSGQVQLVGGDYFPRPNDRVDSLGSGVATSSIEDGKWGRVDVTGMTQRLVGKRNSDYASFELWPTTGTVDADAGDGSLKALIESFLPTREVTIIRDAPRWGFESYCAGSYAWYSSLEVGKLFVRYRLPSGLVRSVELHQGQPALIPAS